MPRTISTACFVATTQADTPSARRKVLSRTVRIAKKQTSIVMNKNRIFALVLPLMLLTLTAHAQDIGT